MTSYYNEIDPYAAQWLRNLVAAGHIAAGDVDERSILDVHPEDLRGYTQCHFFAGIGGWSLALRLAGWPDDRPVWTGSCPCQPFSAAGKRTAFDDERHLWPHWFHLIEKRRPATVFGEQVASPDGLGWLDVVLADLESARYACGAADLCAAGIGAPHIRQRLWFVADAAGQRRARQRVLLRPEETRRDARDFLEAAGRGAAGLVGDADDARSQGFGIHAERADERAAGPAGVVGHWSDAAWLPCRDGKARPVEPGTFPLAHGIPGRVGRLRAYGNAIVPQVAAAFIRQAIDVGQKRIAGQRVSSYADDAAVGAAIGAKA